MARARPFYRIPTFAAVMPTTLAKSLTDSLRRATRDVDLDGNRQSFR
jgi:hypothetical protein